MSRPPPPRSSLSSASPPKVSPSPSSPPPPSNKPPPPSSSSSSRPKSPSSSSPTSSPPVTEKKPSPNPFTPSANELPLSLAISLRGIQYNPNIDDNNNPYIFVSASVLDINSNKFEQGRTEAYPIASLAADIDFRLMIPFVRLIGKKQVLLFDVLTVPYSSLAKHVPNIQIIDTQQGITVPRAILPSACTVQANWTATMKLFFSNASSGCRGFPPLFERMVLNDPGSSKALLAIPPSVIVTGIPSSGLGGTLRPLVGGGDDLGKIKLLFRLSKLPLRDTTKYTRSTAPNCFFVIQRPYYDNNELQWEPAWVSSPLRSTTDGDLPEITVPVIAVLHPKETEFCLSSPSSTNTNELLDRLTIKDIQSSSTTNLKFLFMDWIDNETSTLEILPIGEVDIPLRDMFQFNSSGNTSAVGGKEYPIIDGDGAILHVRSIVYIPNSKPVPKVAPPSASDRKPPPPKSSDTPSGSNRAPPPKAVTPSAGSPKAPPPRRDGSESSRSETPPPTTRKDGPPPSKGAAPPPRTNGNEPPRSNASPTKRDTPPAKSGPPPSKGVAPPSRKENGPKDEVPVSNNTPSNPEPVSLPPSESVPPSATTNNTTEPLSPTTSTTPAKPKETTDTTTLATENNTDKSSAETTPITEGAQTTTTENGKVTEVTGETPVPAETPTETKNEDTPKVSESSSSDVVAKVTSPTLSSVNVNKTISTPVLNKVTTATAASTNIVSPSTGTLATPVLRRVAIPSGTTPTTLAQLQAAANSQRSINIGGGTPNGLNIGDALSSSGAGAISPAMARSVLASAGIPTALLPTQMDDSSVINLARDIISSRLLADVLLRRGIVPNVGSPVTTAPEGSPATVPNNNNVPLVSSSGSPIMEIEKGSNGVRNLEPVTDSVPSESNKAVISSSPIVTPVTPTVPEPIVVPVNTVPLPVPVPESIPSIPPSSSTVEPTAPIVAVSVPSVITETIPTSPALSNVPTGTPPVETGTVNTLPTASPVPAPNPVPKNLLSVETGTVNGLPSASPIPAPSPTSVPVSVPAEVNITSENIPVVAAKKVAEQRPASPTKDILPPRRPASPPKSGPPAAQIPKVDIVSATKEASILPASEPVNKIPITNFSSERVQNFVPSTVSAASVTHPQHDSVLSNLKKQSVHSSVSVSKYLETSSKSDAPPTTKNVTVTSPVSPVPATKKMEETAIPSPPPTPLPKPVTENKDLFTAPNVAPTEILTASNLLQEAIQNHPATKSSSSFSPSSNSISKHVASMLSPYLVGTDILSYDDEDDRTAASALLARVAASAPQWQTSGSRLLFGTHDSDSTSSSSIPRKSPKLSNAFVLASSFALDGERLTKSVLEAQSLGNQKLLEDTEFMLNEYENSLDLREYNFLVSSPQNFAKALGMKPIEQLMLAQHAVNTSLKEIKEGIVTSTGGTNESHSYDPSWVAVGGPTALSDVRNMHRRILSQANAKVRNEVKTLYHDWMHFRTTARELKREIKSKQTDLDAVTTEIQMVQRDIRQARDIGDAEKPQLQADIDSLARDVANMEGITLIDSEQDTSATNETSNTLVDEHNNPIQNVHPDEQLTLARLIAWTKTPFADNDEARSRRLAHAVTSATRKATNDVEAMYSLRIEEIKNLYQLRVISAREDAEAYYQNFIDTEEARVKERLHQAKNGGVVDAFPWESLANDDGEVSIISPATTLAALRGLATGHTGPIHYPKAISPLRNLSPSSRSPSLRNPLPSNEKEMLRLNDDQEMKAQNIRNEIRRIDEKIETARELIDQAQKLQSLKETIRAFWRMSPVGFIPSYYFMADTVNPQSIAAHARATFLHQCIWQAPFSNRFYDKLREIHNQLKHRIDTGQYLDYLVVPKPTIAEPSSSPAQSSYVSSELENSLPSPTQRKSALKSTTPNSKSVPPPWLKDVPTFPPPSGNVVVTAKMDPISRPNLVGRGVNKRNNTVNNNNLSSRQVYSSGIGHHRPVSQTKVHTRELLEIQDQAEEELLQSFTQQFLIDSMRNTNKAESKNSEEDSVSVPSVHQPAPEPLPAPPSLGLMYSDNDTFSYSHRTSVDQRSISTQGSSSKIRPIIRKYNETPNSIMDKSTVSINQNIEGNKVKQLAAALADYLSSRRVIPDQPLSKGTSGSTQPTPSSGSFNNRGSSNTSNLSTTSQMSTPPLPPPPRNVVRTVRTANSNHYTVRQFKGFPNSSPTK